MQLQQFATVQPHKAPGCALQGLKLPSCSRTPRWRRRARPVKASKLQPGGVNFGLGSSGRPGSASWASGSSSSSEAGGSRQLSSLVRLQQQLKTLGLAGVLAYGLFNTVYYVCAFLFFWVYVARVPAGAGPVAAAKAFVQVFAMTWAGSQVSKVPRAAGALLLAPAVDRGLSLLEDKFGLRSRRQAFLVVVACCLLLALVLFCSVVVAWS